MSYDRIAPSFPGIILDSTEVGGAAMKNRYGLEIRAAIAADAPAISELLKVAGHGIAPSHVADRLNVIRKAEGTVLIAVAWGPPSGLVVLHWYPTLETSQPTAEITTLLVNADDRRKGIGRLLVKSAAQAARAAGCGTLELLATPQQSALYEFCRATGFVETGSCFVRSLRRGMIVPE